MLSIFYELIRFIKDPYTSDYNYNAYSVKQKLALFGRLLFLNFIITIIAIVFLIIEKHILNKFGIEIKNLPIDKGNYYEPLICIFAAPLLEELVFRLPLSFRKRDINIAYLVLIGAIIINLNIFDTDIKRRMISFSLLFLSTLPLYFLDKVQEKSLEKIKNNYGKYIVWGSIVFFSCAHISNIDNFELKLLPVYLINLFPIFSFAMFASFCRLKLGFLYGVLLHICNNLIPAFNSLLS